MLSVVNVDEEMDDLEVLARFPVWSKREAERIGALPENDRSTALEAYEEACGRFDALDSSIKSEALRAAAQRERAASKSEGAH